jgi:long-chain fatty acid transport protein
MTQLQAREVSGGLTAVRPSFKFDNKGSQVGVFNSPAGDGGDAGSWAVIPNGYISWALNKDLYLGLGIGAPFGNATKYDKPWKGSAQSNEFDIKTININPSIAYRVNDMVSLGAGVSWQKIEADYYRQWDFLGPGARRRGIAHEHRRRCLGLEPRCLVYALADDQGRRVVSLDHPVPHRRQGQAERRWHAGRQCHRRLGLRAAGGQSDVKADLEVPDTFILSVTQKLSDRWEMLGDVFVDGLEFDQERRHHPHLGAAGQTAQVLHGGFPGYLPRCPGGQLQVRTRSSSCSVWPTIRRRSRRRDASDLPARQRSHLVYLRAPMEAGQGTDA